MSTGVEVVILTPMILSALAKLGIGLAAAAAGSEATRQLAGAAQAAVDTLAEMRAEHQQALAEMAQRQEEALAESTGRTAEEAESAGVARSLAQMTLRRAAGGTRQMLLAGVERLQTRTAGLDPRPPDLDHALVELRERLADEAADLAAALEQYQTLAALAAQAALEQAQLHAGDEPAAPVLALLAELAVLLESPLFATAQGQAEHAALREKYAEVERLAEGQAKLAESLAGALRTRVTTVLDAVAAELTAQERRAEKLREDTGQLLRLLTALSAAGVPPDDRAKATVLRARLALALAEADDTALAVAVGDLLAEAQALYAAVEQALTAQVAQAVVGSQVCDVLHGLGYSVELLDEPQDAARHFHIALNDETGMELQLGADGLLKSEMVAYTPLDEAAAQENEKLACHVVDALLAELRERKLDVKEKFRTHYARGERPPVVQRKRKQARPAQQPEPQQRKLVGDE